MSTRIWKGWCTHESLRHQHWPSHARPNRAGSSEAARRIRWLATPWANPTHSRKLRPAFAEGASIPSLPAADVVGQKENPRPGSSRVSKGVFNDTGKRPRTPAGINPISADHEDSESAAHRSRRYSAPALAWARAPARGTETGRDAPHFRPLGRCAAESAVRLTGRSARFHHGRCIRGDRRR